MLPLACPYPDVAVRLMCVKGLTTALIYLPTDHFSASVNCAVFWRCSASLRVCWGGVYNTGALTRGKSGADMKHIRRGWGVRVMLRPHRVSIPLPAHHWMADIRGKKKKLQLAEEAARSAWIFDVAECPGTTLLTERTCLFTLMGLDLSLHQNNYLIQELHVPKSRLK